MIGLSAEQKGRMGHGIGTQVLSVLPQQIYTGHQTKRHSGNLYKWFFDNLVFDNYTLDFDSTVMVREGFREEQSRDTTPSGRDATHTIR